MEAIDSLVENVLNVVTDLMCDLRFARRTFCKTDLLICDWEKNLQSEAWDLHYTHTAGLWRNVWVFGLKSQISQIRSLFSLVAG